MPFNNFPFTNLNDVNLDFLLRGFQSMKTTLDQIEGQLAALGPYQNVKEALEAMLASGELADLADQILAGVDSVTSNGDDKVMGDPDPDDIAAFTQLASMTADDIYNRYNALGVFTKHVYGSDAVGNDLVYYEYEAPVLKNSQNKTAYVQFNNGLPALLAVSGIHGSEKGSVAAMYMFFKELFLHPEKYGSIVNNISITVVPVANPSGFNANLRRNSNNVDINRNFPNGWTAQEFAGSAPLDQPESAFLADLIDTKRSEFGSGLFVCDMHQFLTTSAQEKLFWYNCSTATANYPQIRNNLLKTVGYLRRVLLAKYPQLTPTISNDRFMDFFQIDNDATLMSYAHHKGCSGFLCESPSQIAGGQQYTAAVLDIAYKIHANSVWSTLAQFFPYPQEAIRSLSEIGMTEDNTLPEIMAAMPYRSCLDIAVSQSSALHDEICPVMEQIHLHIQAVGENSKSLVAYSIGTDGPTTFLLTNTAQYNQLVNKWSFPITPTNITANGTIKDITLQGLRDWQQYLPLQILYTKTGGELGVPNEGLLLVFHAVTDQWYDHTWLVNISSGLSVISFAHYAASTSTLPLTWRKVNTTT